jgi:Cu-Zn family superoxide dismutase
MKKFPIYACLAGALLLVNACGTGGGDNKAQGVDTVVASGTDPGDTVTVVGEEPSDSPTGLRAGQRAVATINGKSGTSVTGTATFTQTGDNKVRMVLNIDKAPQGVHGIHLHQNGNCDAPDASSAGPHWNPTKQPHGNREAGNHHMGDLPNLTVGADGRGRAEMEVEGWTIGGSDTTTNIVNHAIVIHAKADDYKTQPSGDSGDRIGCGVITAEATAGGQ